MVIEDANPNSGIEASQFRAKRARNSIEAEYDRRIKRIENEEDPVKLQNFYNSKAVKYNFVIHNARGSDPLFTTFGAFMLRRFGVRTILIGDKADELTRLLKERGVSVVKKAHMDDHGQVDDLVRAFRTKDIDRDGVMDDAKKFVDKHFPEGRPIYDRKKKPFVEPEYVRHEFAVKGPRRDIYFPPVEPFWPIKTLNEIEKEQEETGQ
ncbi:MAG TPA: hypothetical protein VHE53_01770 [Patescibacteria group bacterium]|nr:hypothetical protein [Patescibacteria group bacterium]